MCRPRNSWKFPGALGTCATASFVSPKPVSSARDRGRRLFVHLRLENVSLLTTLLCLFNLPPHLTRDCTLTPPIRIMDNPRNDANDQERDAEAGSAATTDELQTRQRGSLPSFLFITFLFFMLTNRNEDDIVVRTQYEDAIRALGYQLSNYSAWLNGTTTNFTLVRGSKSSLCLMFLILPSSQPERNVHLEPLVSKILPIPHQLDPLLGSYYSNTSGLFRGDVRYYNLSSIPYNSNVTWKPIADRVMENANLSAIPERLGSWNWSAADTVAFRVHDIITTVTNVSENIAIFQVLCSLFHRA